MTFLKGVCSSKDVLDQQKSDQVDGHCQRSGGPLPEGGTSAVLEQRTARGGHLLGHHLRLDLLQVPGPAQFGPEVNQRRAGIENIQRA